jgi:acyl-CoA reductase-like NAD-dependent aldehyde dehydrogenase
MITKPLLSSYAKLTTFPLSSTDPAHRFEVHNPATGENITTIQGGSALKVEQAVQTAQKAYQKWRWVSPRERSRLLFAVADELGSRAEELAQLLSLENGKTVSQAREGDVPFLASVFRYFASLCDKLSHELYDNGGIYSQVQHEPYGVVVGILPFNWPPIHVGGKSAPAIAAGKTIIIKPGEQAPLTVMRIVEIIQKVLPEGVIQAIPATGIDVPQGLLAHKLVKKVSFTGSTRGGAAVSKLAADTIKPLSLELTGKNALIVFDDADIDLTVGCAIDGAFFNQGEACTAASRLLVHRHVHDEFLAKLARAVCRLKVGHGADEETHVGPLITKAHQEKVEEYIRIGIAEGATVAAQAPKPTDPDLAGGFYVQPTLFANVSKDMRIAKEEIFGPVVTVIPFDTYDEAISITNESEYGLVCAIFSRDQTKAMRAAREIDVGMCFVNNYSRLAVGTPFGGAKASGYGREHCIQTLKEYSRPKNMFVPSGVGPVPGWRMVPELLQEDARTDIYG